MIQKLKNIYAQEGFRKYLINTSWMFGEKIIRLLMGLLVASQVARYLGVENYGIINYGISVVMIFSSFATLGLEDTVITRLVHNDEDEYSILGTAFLLRICASVVAVMLTGIFVYYLARDYKVSMYIGIIALGTFFQPFNVIDLYFQSKVKSRFLVIASLFSLFVCSGLRLYFIWIKAPLSYFVWVVFLDTLFLAMGLIFFYTREGHRILKWRFNRAYAHQLLLHSFPIAAAAVAVTIYMRIDQVIIREKLDLVSVGNYSAAARISELWYFIPMAISSSLFPAIINAKKISEELYRKRLQQLCDFMTAISVTIAILVSLTAPYIIRILFGSKFAQAADVLTIHIWAGVFVFLGVACGKFTVLENLNRQGLYRTLMGVVVNVSMNLLLIPHFGIKGAAVTALLSQLVSAYLGNVFWKRSRPIFVIASRSLNIFGVIKRFVAR